MSRKFTKKEILQKANLIHNNRYDYSKVDYKSIDIPIEIICPIHSSFFQRPYLHMKGAKCQKCSGIEQGNKTRKTLEKFIEQANKVHNFKYDYTNSVYLGDKEKIEIKCPLHNIFTQLPTNHLKGHGCIKCSGEEASIKYTLSLEEVISKFKQVHGNKYNYDKFIYTSSKVKSTIVCYEHGNFEIEASSHLQGHGCMQCGINKRTKNITKTLEEFKLKAISIHSYKYDYSLVEYINAIKKVKIICNTCKTTFLQSPDKHTNQKYGCRNCGNANNYHKETWIKRANGKKGTFYIIRCFNDIEEFFKFGITFNSVQKRYIHKSFMPYNYEIIREVKSKNLSYIWNLEKRFKRFKRKNHYKPLIHFAGDKQECFKN